MRRAAKKYSIDVHIWIKEEKGHFLGKGRVQLLENIKSEGSITRGAKAMKMSYRQAWQMIEDMNKYANEPLVEKVLGGKGGGGAIVTEAGEKAIKLFYTMEEKIKKYSNELSKKLYL
jgi:molybdate transport system regulatory protein